MRWRRSRSSSACTSRDEEVRGLLDLARSLEGLTRNAGTHAGGVVIAPSVLTDFTPLFSEAGGSTVVTQFDKDDVEAAGLVKFDFLGLRTLTIIDRAVRIINALPERRDSALDMATLPMDDAATFALMKTGFTTAVFQLESRGMKDLIRRLKPDRFEDVVALVALFRPGPLQSGMVDDFIARKHSPGTAIDYLHPLLKPVLETTYGVILYQEQVMKIAQVLSGYTLGGADLLRRAMGKKKPEEMAKQRSVFVDGAVARGVESRQAAFIFDLIEKFAGYGFNKSHSAAYAVLSYQTAWLKAHYPAGYMAAVLSADIDDTDKVVTMVDECARMGLTILPPGCERFRLRLHRGRRARHPVRTGCGARRRCPGGRGAGRRADGQRTLHQPRDAVQAQRPHAHEPACAGSPHQVGQPRRIGREPGDAGGRSGCCRAGWRAGDACRCRGPGRPVRRRAGGAGTGAVRANGANRFALPVSARPSGCTSPDIRYSDTRRTCPDWSVRGSAISSVNAHRSQAKAAVTMAAARSARPD